MADSSHLLNELCKLKLLQIQDWGYGSKNAHQINMPSAAAPSANRTEKRMNIVLRESAYAEVYELSRSTKRSLTDLVRLGLGLVKIALEAGSRGEKLMVTNSEGKPIKELIIPGL